MALIWVQILSILPMLDRAIDGLKSDEAKALREFSDPTSLLLALRSRNCWALANVVLNSSDSVASADANNLSLMAFSTESACSTEQ